jgi:hypothetical protein
MTNTRRHATLTPKLLAGPVGVENRQSYRELTYIPGTTRRPPPSFQTRSKGSRNKYEYDPDLDLLVFDRFLSASVVFPTDYGFIRDAYSPDGDPMDVLITVSEPTFPGCAIHTKPVALSPVDATSSSAAVRGERWTGVAMDASPLALPS